jgi:hypothetical protein
MSAFTIDDIVLDYLDKDYAPERREPKENVFFEFEVKQCVVKRAKAGHLMAKITVEALDADGSPMFKQWINTALPVSVGDVTPPDYAKKIFLSTMRPLLPDNAAYDIKLQDPASKKFTYYKNGEVVKGKEFDEAVIKQNRANAAIAKHMAAAFVQSEDDECEFDGLNGNHFFGKVEKKGDYTNVKYMEVDLPEGSEVIYQKAEAFA